MWCWALVICLVGVLTQISSQPITKENGNERTSRQPNIAECCPCPTPRDVDDCPCRLRSADSDGASSIVLPTAVRTDGVFLRLADLEEDVPPFLHPEVELASSVLQTLREATDEEYQEALERDAKRNAMKEAQLTDTESEDSGSEEVAEEIITIIVHPRTEDDEDMEDTEPQPSHPQETRCERPPLSSTKSDLSPIKILPKLTNIFNQRAIVPKIKSSNLLHKNQLNEDNDVSASDVQERQNQEESKSDINSQKSNLQMPIHKLFSSINKTPTQSINVDLVTGKNKSPLTDLRSPFLQKLWRNTEENHTEPNFFTNLIPKLPTDKNNLSQNKNSRLKGSLSSDMKSNLNNILENAKLSNLWKLRDVELFPPLIKGINRNNIPATNITHLPSLSQKDSMNSRSRLKVKHQKIDSDIVNSECSSEVNDNNQATSNNNLDPKIRDSSPDASNFKDIFERDNSNIITCQNELPNSKKIQTSSFPRDSENIGNKQHIIVQPIDDSSNEFKGNTIHEENIINEVGKTSDDNSENTSLPCNDLTTKDANSDTSLEDEDNSGSMEEDSVKSVEIPESSDAKEKYDNQIDVSVEETIQSPIVDRKKELSKPAINFSSIREDIQNRLQKIKIENYGRQFDKNYKTIDFKIKKADLDFIETEANMLTTTPVPDETDTQQLDPGNCPETISNSMLRSDKEKTDLRSDENSKKVTKKNFKMVKPKMPSTDRTQARSEASPNSEDDSCISLSSSPLKDLQNNGPIDAAFDNRNRPVDIEPEASNLITQRVTPIFERSGSLLDIPTPLSLENLAQSLPPLDIFKNPLPALEPLPLFEGFKMKLSDIFRANDDSSEETITSQENNRDPVMATDSSTPSFQFQLPPLKPPSFSNLEFRPLGSPTSFFGKSSNDDLSLRVSDAFENIADDLKSHFQKAHEKLKLSDPLNLNLEPGFPSTDFSDRLESHTKDTLKLIGDKFRETGESLGLNKPLLEKSIFSTLPRADPDIKGTLKSIHEHLKERLDLVHSPSIRQNNFNNIDKKKISSNFLGGPSSLNRDNILKKNYPYTSRSNLEMRNNQGTKLGGMSRNSKPKATAMQIPKTVQVPQLKAVNDKPNLKSIHRFPTTRTTLPSYSNTLQNIHKDKIEPQTNSFKNNKIKVSFTTTPRPLRTLKHKHTLTTSKPVLKGRENNRLNSIKDSRGAMSEIEPSIRFPASSKNRQDDNEDFEQKKVTNRPWPTVTESSFLTKVKEAVKARLPHIDTKAASKSKVDNIQADGNNRNEMSSSPSENLQMVDLQPLKENVSYRCRMICTRE